MTIRIERDEFVEQAEQDALQAALAANSRMHRTLRKIRDLCSRPGADTDHTILGQVRALAEHETRAVPSTIVLESEKA